MLELLMNRKSVRKFQKRKVEKIKINSLVKAALTSPSGKDENPTDMIIIEDQTTINKIGDALGENSLWTKSAPLNIVLTSDISQSNTWKSDASIMATIVQLMGEALGLKSCWVHLENRTNDEGVNMEDFVKETLDIPIHHRVLCLIALGYPDEEIRKHDEKDFNYEKIHYEKY